MLRPTRSTLTEHSCPTRRSADLLRRFRDWDRALRRLDELNARVEDPKLWNDPKAAQEVMRERRRLDDSIATVKAIESERDDTVELIEMAEAESDEAMANEIGRAHV